ncbi:hypothetical protein [Laribacter hongkongensis]|uniref:Uncharacterized protein n=1 Tax=Laribacter hongkongensis TaxID=168471 RepID=A0ABD4SNS7_9NEIS|nr:hypothetical protein [Laribacter hongkongensis]MCG9024499.1 hypothetical protein [Laribacter hongkongensis]
MEKDRAEQQMVLGVLDYVREWLSFTLPPPADKDAANALMKERNKNFLARLPLHFTTGSKAKVTTYMETKTAEAEPSMWNRNSQAERRSAGPVLVLHQLECVAEV